jgi:hypothetical protein
MNLEHFIESIPDNISNNIFYKIENYYEEIKDHYKDLFSIIIYYLEENLCKIIVRRLDENSGWGKDLKITLFSSDKSKKQIISIGSHTKNTKIIEVDTDFELKKLEEFNITQIKVIQAKEDNNINTHQEYLNLTDLIYENTNINYEFFNIIKQREFIKNNFEKYIDKFDLFYNCYYKYLIFICCYLYLNGGIYISNNIQLLININDINIEKNSYFIDSDDNELLFLCIEKNNIEIINYLNNILDNINNSSNSKNKNILNNFIEFKNIKNYKNDSINSINNYIINNHNIFKIDPYKFIMNSDIKYIIVYLDENYYLLKPFNKYNIIEKELFIKCINESNHKVSNIEIKTDKNNYKTNNVFFFTV